MCHLIPLVLVLAASGPESDISSDEQVIFFPTIARPGDQGSEWLLDIHGWIFEREWLLEHVASLKSEQGIPTEDATPKHLENLQRRAKWFLVDNERGERVPIRIADTVFPIPKSTPNGHFHGQVALDDAVVQRILVKDGISSPHIVFQAVTPEDRTEVFAGRVYIVPKSGLSIISDIDDTIKISEVTDKKALLKNTFLRPFRAVPGTPEVYREWLTNKSATFHYVSASPWQLFAPLQSFMQSEVFPGGTFHLKLFRWKDESFLNLFESGKKYKIETITAILEKFPDRRFVLVGDSGEKDPEAYGHLARQFSESVVRILIRDVTDESPDSRRYRDAFHDLPRELWRIFDDPSEIRDALP